MLMKNNWLIEEIKREIKRYIEMNNNDSTTNQNMGHSKRGNKKKVHIIKGLSLIHI